MHRTATVQENAMYARYLKLSTLVHKQLACSYQNYQHIEGQWNEELIEVEGDSGGLTLLNAVFDPGLKPGLGQKIL